MTTRKYLLVLGALLISGCDRFGYQPLPYPVWSPIPTRTPAIYTATPIIAQPAGTGTATLTPPFTETPSETAAADTQTPPPTASSTPAPAVEVTILGCNTSFDILHGMDEVTNAYVTLSNTGPIDLTQVCGLLRASDEDREHPDKQACVPSLPAGHRVTVKLTVDTAFKQDTAIQVDVLSNEALLLRVDRPFCTDIKLLGGEPSDLNVVQPGP